MSPTSLHALAARGTRPDAAAVPPLPMLSELADVLPPGALRRGSTVTVEGSTTLALALLAGASAAGAWCAVVGVPELGVLAAAELGVALERLVLVPRCGSEWVAAVAALVDAFDVVAVRAEGRVRPGDVRRLSARARHRGAVLVPLGPWEGAQLRLCAVDEVWYGLGAGHGRLHARELTVRVSGHGMAPTGRDVTLWLPTPDGGADRARQTHERRTRWEEPA